MFQLMKDPLTGEVSTTMILYTDPTGAVWSVPEGHRFWDLYQTWLSEGNTPLPAA